MSLPFVPLLIAITLLGVVVWLRSRRHGRKYPPGPPARPLVGNILHMPAIGDLPEFDRRKQQYGDLVFYYGLGSKVLVLNSMKAINALLEKRAAIYSDRPSFTVVGELMRLEQSTPLLRYGDDWRMHRKLEHSALGPAAVKQYQPIQEDLAALLAKQMLDDPEGFVDHVRLAAARIVLAITYGLSPDKADNEYVTQAEDTMRMVSKYTHPGAFLADMFPVLKHLPSWMPFHQTARDGKAMIEHLVTKPFEHVKSEMKAGTAPPSLTHFLLTEHNKGDLDHLIKWATGSLYGAHTYATTLSFMMAMALNPDKQRLAQEEIDRVVGTERLPTINDRPRLPYIAALIKEVMRWNPAVPLGLARCTTQDDVYEGHFIPKGTSVLTNVWYVRERAHSKDLRRGAEADWAALLKFVPERYLEEGLSPDEAPIDPGNWAFGFARRLCPGKPLAENSVFILITTILTIFDIGLPEDGELYPQYTTGLISYPLPFKCKITPRSQSRTSQTIWRAAHCTI
ncbi:cytochrome P450 [Daedaleopsis nitida]|nr:cytochrome P450 [Daedaleopsis nitida]